MNRKTEDFKSKKLQKLNVLNLSQILNNFVRFGHGCSHKGKGEFGNKNTKSNLLPQHLKI